MSDPQIALKRWFHEKTAPHGAKKALADATGYTPTQISRMRNLETDDPKKRQEIPLDMIEKAARFFDSLPPGFEGMTQWLDHHVDSEKTVPVVGYVGAGAEAHFYALSDGELDRVPAPENAGPETVAVEIRGESLGPLFARWLVHYDEIRSPITSDLINQLCVVGLPDDRVLVKKVRNSKSKTPGLYDLLSNAEDPIFDVPIAWAAKVKSMVPR
ncbi:hypothetical protein [Devosia sp. 1635]|uniref:hypothetical protein n=1 Tax=Devosia sp. 1635 TaxID=2726066 RepID=UPI001AEEC934|nr:hypothetical protein [Devosia sp. 1635]